MDGPGDVTLYRWRVSAASALLRWPPVAVLATILELRYSGDNHRSWMEWILLPTAVIAWIIALVAFVVLFVCSTLASIGPRREFEGKINNAIWLDAWRRVVGRPAVSRDSDTRPADVGIPRKWLAALLYPGFIFMGYYVVFGDGPIWLYYVLVPLGAILTYVQLVRRHR